MLVWNLTKILSWSSCRVKKCNTAKQKNKNIITKLDKMHNSVSACTTSCTSTVVVLCPVVYCKCLGIPLQDQGSARWKGSILALKIMRIKKKNRCRWISSQTVSWSLSFSSLQFLLCLFSFCLLLLLGQLSQLTLWSDSSHPHPKPEGSIWKSELVWGLIRNGS